MALGEERHLRFDGMFRVICLVGLVEEDAAMTTTLAMARQLPMEDTILNRRSLLIAFLMINGSSLLLP